MPAFRRPESKNAATTLTWMAFILGTLFFGVSLLAQPARTRTRATTRPCSRRWAGRCSATGSLYVLLQFATAAILTLAANTAYADFPRLSSIIARDGYLPRQLANRGDRLVFSNGILVLALLVGLLIVAFGGITNALIPLYAVGVFTSFTLSQAGMVRHHLQAARAGLEAERGDQRRRRGRRPSIVLLIVAITKFTERRVGAARRDPAHRPAVQGHRTGTTERGRAAAERPARLPAAAG